MNLSQKELGEYNTLKAYLTDDIIKEIEELELESSLLAYVRGDIRLYGKDTVITDASIIKTIERVGEDFFSSSLLEGIKLLTDSRREVLKKRNDPKFREEQAYYEKHYKEMVID